MAPSPVLVPLDGSERAEVALPYALAIARALGASLRLLTVIETPEDVDRPAEHDAEDRTEAERQQRERYLHAIAERVDVETGAVELSVVAGEPVEEILAAAGDAVRLTVMATAGRGGIERWFVGSVADKVMRLSSKPVLLVQSREGTSESRRLRRLLVPLDGSPLAEAALPLAGELAVALGASVALARVEPFPPTWPPGAPPDLTGISSLVLEANQQYLDNLRHQLPAQVSVSAIAQWGSPAPVLLDLVERQQIDLVVMTTRGRGGVRRLILGSTADRLVRSGAATLLIPPPAVAPGRARAGDAKPSNGGSTGA